MPSAARPNPLSPQTLLIFAGALGVGGVTVWMLSRPVAAAASLPPGTPGGTKPAPPPPVTFADPGVQAKSLTPAEVTTLRNALLGDPNAARWGRTDDPAARHTITLMLAYRAALYSAGLSNFANVYVPASLLFAAILDPAESDVNNRLGLALPGAGSPTMADALRAFVLYYKTFRPTMRPLPFNLPKTMVDYVNSVIAHDAPEMPRLYVHAVGGA